MSYHRLLSKYLEKEFNLFKKKRFLQLFVIQDEEIISGSLETPASRLRPTLIPDQVYLYYIFSFLGFVLLIYRSMFINTTIFYFILYNVLFIYQTRFIYFLSLTPSYLLSDQTYIFLFHYHCTLSYSYTRPGLYILISLQFYSVLL